MSLQPPQPVLEVVSGGGRVAAGEQQHRDRQCRFGIADTAASAEIGQ